MRRYLVTASLLVAWICANGAVWDLVQVVAWAKMFSGYARVLPVAEALRATFDPAKPCELCATVTNAKAGEQRDLPTPTERSADKLLLAFEAPAKIVLTAPATAWREEQPGLLMVRSDPVPVPPPRA